MIFNIDSNMEVIDLALRFYPLRWNCYIFKTVEIEPYGDKPI